MEEAIPSIISKAVLQYWHIRGNNVKEDIQLMNDIRNLGIDGIEVYSSYHKHEQIKFYHDICQKYNLIETAGSDFSWKNKTKCIYGIMPYA